MQEDSGDLGAPGLFPPERNAVGFEQDCHGDPGNVKFDNCNPSSCDRESFLFSDIFTQVFTLFICIYLLIFLYFHLVLLFL